MPWLLAEESDKNWKHETFEVLNKVIEAIIKISKKISTPNPRISMKAEFVIARLTEYFWY